jgi:ribosomal protein L37AE/L43A
MQGMLQWWLCCKVYRFCFSIVWFCWYLRCITGPLCIFVIVSISLLNLDQDMQYVCPICQQQANMNTIACEECDDWFHFECLGLTSKNIKKIEEEAPYICKECIENQLYQLRLSSWLCTSFSIHGSMLSTNRSVFDPFIRMDVLVW